jgi:hypothetical protein
MNQSSRDHILMGVGPSPGPGRGAVSSKSSRDEHRKRSLPGTTVRREGRAISTAVEYLLLSLAIAALIVVAFGKRKPVKGIGLFTRDKKGRLVMVLTPFSRKRKR